MNTVAAASGSSNVVEFPFMGIRRVHVVDPELVAYVSEVNSIMKEVAGVAYMKLRSSIHGDDNEAMRSYKDRGVDARDAVMEIIDENGLKTVNSRVSPALAYAYNVVQAAICEFVFESPLWHRSLEGQIYSRTQDGLALIRPVPYRKDSPNEAQAFGYGIEIREGAEIDPYTGSIVSEGTPVAQFAGWDIEQAVGYMSSYLASREDTSSFSF